jgi:hypothetical protein
VTECDLSVEAHKTPDSLVKVFPTGQPRDARYFRRATYSFLAC